MTEPNRDITNGPDLPGTPVPTPQPPIHGFTDVQLHGGTHTTSPSEFTPANTAVPAASPLVTAPQRNSETAIPPVPLVTAPQRPSETAIPPSPAAQPLSRSAVPLPSPSRPVKGWESIPWPLGGNPFGPHIPWVGLCSPAIFQPLAFDLGYWLEYWAKPEVGGSGSISLIEAVRRALPVHLDAGWRIEYCGPSHQFLRHSEHPWIFQIKEKRTALGPLDNLPSYFGIGQPNGRFGCPNTSGIEVRLITTTLEHASAVAREVCDLRAGTSDIAASFFRDRSPDSVRWGIIAHLSSFITTPAHPQRHARPGFDAARWWSSPDQRIPFDTLRALWALKILHAACLRHRLTRLSDEWER